MKIDKWIDFGQEVEISLSSEDIYIILQEDKEGYDAVLRNFNTVATFLKGVPESIIDEMNESVKNTIHDFLSSQAKRYNSPSVGQGRVAPTSAD